ncbi:lyase family protein [Paractinoplanes lichenicola]|uniref:3-carboxy-cis,cis-muconate cycloisomerase n=1 Tax=Paractinoplanes lichenicola TaxID=2802976 RepID=A0ABS1W5B4_9ACTN|nr:lyase family protein [Actinoplanes lichenicola]MBL7261738.1 3-carboxy-cis,cis-muconate cycloisomerase [Actinoplanes lichenicola]
MSDLLWPGDARAGDLCTDASVLAALLRVESAWIDVDLSGLAGPDDLPFLSSAAEEGGNPVIPLLSLLRSRFSDPRLHAGLTSQDVLDTALMLCLRDASSALRGCVEAQISTLAALADRHRHTDMAGRTLTQHAVPITFGLKVASWLQGVLDARDALAAATLPIQLGGAAGSLAAVVAIEGSPDLAVARVAATAARLGLPLHQPWHTGRAPLTRFGDALVTCTDAWGRIANDVLLLTRPELGELTLTGGGSSAMPNKRNPTLAVLVRRAALAGPPLAATLHTAAANMIDERPDGAWHVEWSTARTLTRRTVAAGSQTAEMLAGLQVNTQRMAATLAAARPGIDAEQRKYAAPSSHAAASSRADPSSGAASSGAASSSRVASDASSRGAAGADGSYRGATDQIIDAALARAGEK